MFLDGTITRKPGLIGSELGLTEKKLVKKMFDQFIINESAVRKKSELPKYLVGRGNRLARVGMPICEGCGRPNNLVLVEYGHNSIPGGCSGCNKTKMVRLSYPARMWRTEAGYVVPQDKLGVVVNVEAQRRTLLRLTELTKN